jgi:hypothetical protein
MRSEINLIGQIIASQSMTPEQLAAAGMEISRKKSGEVAKISPARLSTLRQEYVARQLIGYAQNKATPVYGLGKEILTGHDFMGRPLPWSSDKGTPKKPPVSWGEFAWSKAPIPLSAAAGYVYDQLRKAGASVTDASMWMRAVMVGGVSATTGIDPKEIKDPAQHRTRNQAQVGH